MKEGNDGFWIKNKGRDTTSNGTAEAQAGKDELWQVQHIIL